MMMLTYSIGLTTGSCLAYALDLLLGAHVADPCLYAYNATSPAAANASSMLQILVDMPSTDLFPG
jgi:hypothetical protein